MTGISLWEQRPNSGILGRFEMNLSYRNREVTDLFRSYFFEDKRNLSTWGVTPRYILEKPLWIFPNKLIFGLDFYYSDSNVFSESAFSDQTGWK